MIPHSTNRRTVAASAVLALAAATLLGACGDDDAAQDSPATTEAAAMSSTSAAAGAADYQVSGAWARTSPAMASAGAVYLELTNPTDTDDAIVGVAVAAEVAGRAELHETVEVSANDMGNGMNGTDMGNGMNGTDMGNGMNGSMNGTTAAGGSGMMEMVHVDEIPVPAGETAVLKPGGYHIMLLELPTPLIAGDMIDVTLTLRNAGEITLKAEVRDTAP
ncbi:MAG: copper chaperone PCu(A)C [Actinobacteria bacterium]|nr:copper chaperone PCu(A)C [Actinomycetota bacterium]